MNRPAVVLELTRLESAHLAGLVGQFAELLDEGAARAPSDPAVRRLVPDAYADADAAREFRRLTETDLLSRRGVDAAVVRATLGDVPDIPEDPDDPALLEVVAVALTADQAQSWLRTLAAIRLVMATRLGIADADHHDARDPRFGIYDWLGYRLDALVGALDTD